MATISLAPGCPGWAFTTTGHPAARAEQVSFPATEMASGKLLAANAATGPTGMSIRRMSGLGSGLRSGMAWSIRPPTHDPSSMSRANILSWLTVRARSPFSRGSAGRPVSAAARSTRASPTASISSPIATRNRARS